MKTIKIKFVDFWPGFDPKNSLFHSILSKNYKIEYSESPDYLFYSVFGYQFIQYDCIRIFYTGEQVSPDFDLADYAIGFDYISFGDRYLRYPLYNLYYSSEKILSLNYPESDDYYLSRDFSTFVSSNPDAKSQRDLFFNKLMNYRFVSSGGKHLNNVDGPVKDKNLFLSKHKFNIAFENTKYAGYTTEKIVDAFMARTVPIYYGNPLISSEFNKDSFINVSRFDSIESAIDFIIAVDNDDEAYLKMLKSQKFNSTYDAFESLDNFLISIFDQDIEKAGRRPYSQRSMRKKTIYLFLYRINRVYNMFPRFIKKLLRKVFLIKSLD